MEKFVNHETHTVFHVCKVNQGMILFSCEICTISKNIFFTENLQATASVKIEMQVEMMTSKQTNLHTTSMVFLASVLQTSTSETTPLQQQLRKVLQQLGSE